MSLLGGIGHTLGGLFKDTPGGMSASDKLTLIGSALTDFGNGGSPEMTMQARKMISGNAEERQKKAAMEQLSQMLMGGAQQQPLSPQMPASPVMQGPGMDGGPVGVRPPLPQAAPTELPQRGPMTMNDPRMLPMAIAAMRAGVNLGPAMDVLKAQQPDVRYDRGFGYNGKTGDAMGGFHPDLDKGQTFSDGRVSNLPGAVGAASEMAAGTTGAQEQQKSLYDLIDVPQADGSVRKMTRFQAAQTLSGGNVPQGFGVSQTPGAKVEQEGSARTVVDRAAAQPQAFSGLQDQARTTGTVISSIDKALGQIGKFSTGFGANLAGIKGTSAHDLQATLDTIRANVGFDRLQSMRQNSPTGGALGAISERENVLLQSVMGALDQGQSPDQLRQNLQNVRAQLADIAAQRERIYNSTYGSGGGSGGSPTPTRAGGGGGSWTPAQARAELARRRAAGGQ